MLHCLVLQQATTSLASARSKGLGGLLRDDAVQRVLGMLQVKVQWSLSWCSPQPICVAECRKHFHRLHMAVVAWSVVKLGQLMAER